MPTVHLNILRQDIRDVERALHKLKKTVEKSGNLKKLHELEGYERPGIKRNRKKAAGIMRRRREQAKLMLPPKLY